MKSQYIHAMVEVFFQGSSGTVLTRTPRVKAVTRVKFLIQTQEQNLTGLQILIPTGIACDVECPKAA